MKFLIATNNEGKLKEIRHILAQFGIEGVSLREAGVDSNPEETGTTFADNARIKAFDGMKATGMPAVADDSGLMVDALHGAPGIYSARYAGENASDSDRIEKLLDEMRNVPAGARTARFVCAVCCVFPDGNIINASGECDGAIAFEPQGHGGFGYDPIFIEKTTGKSFALLAGEEKDRLSHRGKALAAFAKYLDKKFGGR
ncbi:MAG TPA: RdgB/HAM1 family non-canonical purine NTP pyrophosphatase [Ruminiclostridium sp.]|nr:RdgB/HAM1 family non-canonical purine NTP pyrophosphatase [Ruminiclostridium sp.]